MDGKTCLNAGYLPRAMESKLLVGSRWENRILSLSGLYRSGLRSFALGGVSLKRKRTLWTLGRRKDAASWQLNEHNLAIAGITQRKRILTKMEGRKEVKEVMH